MDSRENFTGQGGASQSHKCSTGPLQELSLNTLSLSLLESLAAFELTPLKRPDNSGKSSSRAALSSSNNVGRALSYVGSDESDARVSCQYIIMKVSDVPLTLS